MALRERVKELEARVAFFELHADAVGIIAEAYVVGLVGGAVARDGKSDVIARNGSRLEIKYSSLRLPKRAKKIRAIGTCLWGWSKLLGLRRYNQLILIGDAETPYRSAYLCPNERYILFDVPYFAVKELVTRNGQHVQIGLNANPASARGVASVLFKKYQVTASELKERYGRSASELAGRRG
jgi:hypothetical protein